MAKFHLKETAQIYAKRIYYEQVTKRIELYKQERNAEEFFKKHYNSFVIEKEEKEKDKPFQEVIYEAFSSKYGEEKYSLYVTISNFFFCFFLALEVLKLIAYVITVNPIFLTTNPIIILLYSIFPCVTWLFQTECTYWSFYARKRRYFIFIALFVCINIIQPFIHIFWELLTPWVLSVPHRYFITEGMLVQLVRYASILPALAFMMPFYIHIYELISDENIKEFFLTFKLRHIVDLRENKENMYDLSHWSDIETGKPILILEEDRFTHYVTIGNTGVGKTSMDLINSILADLNKKLQNDTNRRKCLIKLIFDGKATIELPYDFQDDDFEDSYVKPLKGYEKEYMDILSKYRTCGIVVLAPNSDLPDQVMDLAIARKFKPIIIDPTLQLNEERYNKYKSYWKGINMFHLPTLLDRSEASKTKMFLEAKLISEVAKNFSTVMENLEKNRAGGGGGNPFFSGVNNRISDVVVTITLLYNSRVKNKQTHIDDIQRGIIKFDTLLDMVLELEDIFGYVPLEPNLKRGANTVGLTKALVARGYQVEDEMKMGRGEDGEVTMKPSGKKSITGTQTKFEGSLGYRVEDTPHESLFLFFYENIMGKQESYEQFCIGLQNNISNFLGNPFYREQFLRKDCIDMDSALEKGDIVVVNYAYENGEEVATSFALFFQFNWNLAVFRRPGNKDTRCPFFEYIDELPIIIGPWVERLLSFARQYRLALILALQTLEQTKKNEITKYIEGLLVGVGTIVVFGRASATEMKLFSSLSGKYKDTVSQHSISQTSLLDDNPNYVTGDREVEQEVMVQSETDIRQRDFSEATLITIREGRVLPGIHVKGHFLPKKERGEQPVTKIKWRKIASQYGTIFEEEAAKITYEMEKRVDNKKEEYSSVVIEVKNPILNIQKSETNMENNMENDFVDVSQEAIEPLELINNKIESDTMDDILTEIQVEEQEW